MLKYVFTRLRLHTGQLKSMAFIMVNNKVSPGVAQLTDTIK